MPKLLYPPPCDSDWPLSDMLEACNAGGAQDDRDTRWAREFLLKLAGAAKDAADAEGA